MKIHISILLVFCICLSSYAANHTNYTSLDNADPISFFGDHIIYQGEKIVLNNKAFFIDGGLSDAEAANYPFVFNTVTDALKQLTDGSETEPMTLYIAPYVYWIDNPDDPTVRKPTERGTPFGQVVKCNWLRFQGLTGDARNVVLASRRGQTQGADGNFTMFFFDGDGISSENITFGNYCNVDLEFPLLPELNRAKRSNTITQAQLIICNSDKVVARNTHFISRLNLCPFAGAKRIIFDRCYFESTDDALCGTGVYLDCKFTFFSSKPFYNTYKTGAVFLNCDFDVLTQRRQYLAKVGSPVTIVDSRFHHATNDIYIGWTQDPTDDLRCYQYNVTLNGKPLFINAEKPEATVDMTGKTVLNAYRVEHDGQVIYNTYNLLCGHDDWDPMGVKQQIEQVEKQTTKNLTRVPTYLRISPAVVAVESGAASAMLDATVMRFGNYADTNQPITWTTASGGEELVALAPTAKGNCCEATGINVGEETRQVVVCASTADGLESAALLTVAPKFLEAPHFVSYPRIVKEGKGVLRVDYALDLQGRADQSLITWYRSAISERELIPVAVSRLNQPEYTYSLTAADVGHHIVVTVEPKHLRCHPGRAEIASTPSPIKKREVRATRSYYTDFRNFPTSPQPDLFEGFWTIGGYKPSDLGAYDWVAPAGETWYYGTSIDGMKGTGLVQSQKGARLLYTPLTDVYGDMSLTLNVDPGKQAGQGFGSATGQYMEFYIKYNPHTLTGYGLRIVRTTKYDHAVDFILMKYENGVPTPISEPVSATCYRTGCTISLKAQGNKLTAEVSTTTPLPEPAHPELKKRVELEADIQTNTFGGIGIQHTGSVGASATMLHEMWVHWE